MMLAIAVVLVLLGTVVLEKLELRHVFWQMMENKTGVPMPNKLKAAPNDRKEDVPESSEPDGPPPKEPTNESLSDAKTERPLSPTPMPKEPINNNPFILEDNNPFVFE